MTASAYLKQMQSLSDEHLRDVTTISGERADLAFCYAFLAGNVLLYAASLVRGAAGEIIIPMVIDSSPNVTAGYEFLNIPPEIRQDGLRYARYEDYGRYHSPDVAPPASFEQVMKWVKAVRSVYRARYARLLEPDAGAE